MGGEPPKKIKIFRKFQKNKIWKFFNLMPRGRHPKPLNLFNSEERGGYVGLSQ